MVVSVLLLFFALSSLAIFVVVFPSSLVLCSLFFVGCFPHLSHCPCLLFCCFRLLSLSSVHLRLLGAYRHSSALELMSRVICCL